MRLAVRLTKELLVKIAVNEKVTRISIDKHVAWN